MWYALISSGLLGALSVAFLLWRKSVVETALAESQAAEKTSQDAANRALDELKARSAAYEDQLSRQRDQLDTLRTQRDKAIDLLAKNGNPGSIADLLRQTVSNTSST